MKLPPLRRRLAFAPGEASFALRSPGGPGARYLSRVVGETKRSQHLEVVARELREASKADFAFVLSRKGKLLTSDAPPDMPASGRERIVHAIDGLGAEERTTLVTLPRESLVPFGGAAPVDVYVGLAADAAVVCAVLATWTDAKHALSSLVACLDRLEALISSAGPRSTRVRKRTPTPPPSPRATPEPKARVLTEPPPPPRLVRDDPARRTDAGLGKLGRASIVLGRRSALPAPPPPAAPAPADGKAGPLVSPRGELRPASFPEVQVRESTIGRETLAEIQRDARPSTPDIEIEETLLGRESMAAVERDLLGKERPGSAPTLEIGQAVLGRDSLTAVRSERGSGPFIELGEARLSNASLEAVRADGGRAEPRRVASSAPELELGEATIGRATHDEIRAEAALRGEAGDRPTHPWVEAPADTKRAFQASRRARRVLPPRVTVKLEEIELDGSEDE